MDKKRPCFGSKQGFKAHLAETVKILKLGSIGVSGDSLPDSVE